MHCYMVRMILDTFDNVLTTDSRDAVDIFDRFVWDHLSYSANLADILKVTNVDPDCAYLNAQCAAVHIAVEAAEGYRLAAPYMARAKQNLDTISERERLFVEAVDCWHRRDTLKTSALLKEIVKGWPSDISAAKWAQYHAFNLGDAEGMLSAADAIRPAHEDTPYWFGLRAFALEQSHRLREAEEAGLEAVRREREDRWAHHAVAHVMETQGRLDEGVEWLMGLADTWETGSVFIREHNWWHVGLFELDRDNHQAVLDIFDNHLWGEWPEFGQEQIGAVSALWRMELRGVDVGERWQAVAQKVAEREFEHIQPFHDLHYIFALSRAGYGQYADEFLKSMECYASQLDGALASVWGDVALPLARGIASYARGDHGRMLEIVDYPLIGLHRIGGSHAQRDLFVQSWIDALMKTGRYLDAERALKERLLARPNVACTSRLLSQAAQKRKAEEAA